jgi:hypothetical protein
MRKVLTRREKLQKEGLFVGYTSGAVFRDQQYAEEGDDEC